MSSNKKITMRQLQILIILSAMGTGVIVLPARAAQFLPSGAQDGWIIAVGLTVLAMAIGWLVSTAARSAQSAAEKALGASPPNPHSLFEKSEAKTFNRKPHTRFPGETIEGLSFTQSVSILLGKPVAYSISGLLLLKLIVAAGLELRIFLAVSREIVLPQTPMPAVSGVMLAVCAYAAAKGMETRARVAEVLLAILVLPFLFVFIIAIFDADFSNLQPALANDALSLVLGTLRLGFILTGLECLLLVSPYVPREKSLRKAVVGALGVAGLIITVITVITIASLGRGVETEPWPVLSMMDAVNLPGAFIERQEALMFGFWIVTAFALGNALLFFGGLLACDITRRPKLRTGVIFAAVAVFGVSILPLSRENIFAFLDLMYIVSGVFFLVVLPLILLIAAKKTASTAVLLILAAFTLTGCWDRVEIENRAFVVAMGIDKGEDENYAVTLSVPIIGEKGNEGFPLYGSDGSEEESEAPAHIKTATGQTISDALKKLDAKNEKSLYYGQTKLLVLGESLLEDRELFNNSLTALKSKLDVSRLIHVVSAKSAASILAAKPPGEILPGSYVANIYRDKDKIGGCTFALDFERLSDVATHAAIIPTVKRNENELSLSGAVLMKNMQKSGKLTTDELQGFLWCLNGGNKGAVVVAKDKMSMEIEKHKAEVIFEDTEPLRVIIEVRASGTVEEFERVPESDEILIKLEREFEQVIFEKITATAEILQKQNIDGYNLLETLRKQNYPLYKKYAADWQEIFPRLEIVPRVFVASNKLI